MTGELTREQMAEMQDTHVCGQCGSQLIMIWDSRISDYRLVCVHDRTHQGYNVKTSVYRAAKQGKLDQLAGKGTQKLLEDRYNKHPEMSPLLTKADLATNQLLSPHQLTMLLTWSDHLGLKAYLGHTCVYYGKPYVTADGYYYLLAKRRSDIGISTRPLNAEERINYQVNEGDHAWLAQAWDLNHNLIATGLGIVTKEEIEGKSAKTPTQYRAPVVRQHPQRMAEKRAEWQLLHKIVPLETEIT